LTNSAAAAASIGIAPALDFPHQCDRDWIETNQAAQPRLKRVSARLDGDRAPRGR